MMDDLISRQSAIVALEREKTYCTAYRDGYTPINVFKKYNAGLTDGIKALKKLPSAEPERKKGKWDKERIAFYWHCSECGAAVHCNIYDVFLYPENEELNFCPNCGADMRGEKNENTKTD